MKLYCSHCERGFEDFTWRPCPYCRSDEVDEVKDYDIFDIPIFMNDYYYDFDGDLVAEDSLSDYVDQFRKCAF